MNIFLRRNLPSKKTAMLCRKWKRCTAYPGMLIDLCSVLLVWALWIYTDVEIEITLFTNQSEMSALPSGYTRDIKWFLKHVLKCTYGSESSYWLYVTPSPIKLPTIPSKIKVYPTILCLQRKRNKMLTNVFWCLQTTFNSGLSTLCKI